MPSSNLLQTMHACACFADVCMIMCVVHCYYSKLCYSQLSAEVDRLKLEVTACQQEKEVTESLYMDKLQRKIGSQPCK